MLPPQTPQAARSHSKWSVSATVPLVSGRAEFVSHFWRCASLSPQVGAGLEYEIASESIYIASTKSDVLSIRSTTQQIRPTHPSAHSTTCLLNLNLSTPFSCTSPLLRTARNPIPWLITTLPLASHASTGYPRSTPCRSRTCAAKRIR